MDRLLPAEGTSRGLNLGIICSVCDNKMFFYFVSFIFVSFYVVLHYFTCPFYWLVVTVSLTLSKINTYSCTLYINVFLVAQ